MRPISFGVMVTLALLVSASCVTAQITLPVRQYTTLSVELQSLRDNITLFRGDPQHLLQMEVRPNRFRPRIDYIDQAEAILKIRDLYAADHPDFDSQSPAERDKAPNPPLEETWEIRLSPVAPTEFSLQCERGESSFDFTDFEVQRVAIRTEETKLNVDFASPNPIQLERFAARIIAGSLHFQHMINARAKEISLDVAKAECRLEITGKEFDGESEINILGAPAQLHLLLSRKVGLRVTAPAAMRARFKTTNGSSNGEEWLSKGYADAKCHVHLTFGSDVTKLGVDWE